MKKISRCSALTLSAKILFLVLSALNSVCAQAPVPDASTKIVSRSQLVLVPVIVRDKSGHPAKGLTRQDFIVQENGKNQTVAIFDEVSTSSAPLSRPAVTGEFTNIQPATDPRRLVIMVLDRMNTPMFDQNYARYQLAKYLSTALSDNALVALVTLDLGGIRVIRDFTDDRDALLAELAEVRSAPDYGNNVFAGAPDKFGDSGSIMEALMKESGEREEKARAEEKAGRSHQSIRRTLDAMEKLARAYSGVPGRKALVWITAGFPFSVNSAGRLLGTLPQGVRDSLTELMPIYERTWRVLNDANMSVYTVDARGLVANSSEMYQAGTNTGYLRPKNYVERWREEELKFGDTIATMRSFAEMTGGKAYVNTNDLTSSFRDAADDSSHYYMLGYYLDSKDTNPGWRNLKVRTRKEGLELRTRAGFFIDSKRDESKHDLDLALTSPLQLTEVPLTVRWTEQKPIADSPEIQTGFTITLRPEGIAIDEASGNRMGFEALAIAVSPDGKPASDVAHKAETRLTAPQVESIRKQGASYNDFLKLKPGSYTVRFVIRDLVSGRIGSVIAPLTVAK